MNTLETEILKINPQFPVNGKDNSSQGFRSNFAYIKNSLEYVSNSINNILLAQPDSLPIITTTATASTKIKMTDSLYNIIHINNDIPDISIELSGTISNILGKTKLQIQNNSTISSIISFTGTYLPDGISVIHTNINAPFIIPANVTFIVECWSADNGLSFFIDNIGQFNIE